MKKARKGRKRLWLLLFAVLVISWGIVYALPVKEKEKHPFFDNDRPLVMAHQGGAGLAPSSTFAAFDQAMELDVDVIEFDVHMTKDGHLVAIHDPTVDRTTDGTGNVNDMTLEEVQSLDAGATFQAEDGSFPYRNQGVIIPTVEDILTAYPDMRWNIEIKDTNDPALYQDIAEKLWHMITDFGVEDKVLLASFDHEIIKLLEEVSDGQAIVAGGKQEIVRFVLLHKLFLNGMYWTDIDAIEIPTSESFIRLDDKKLVRAAEKHGIDMHYWTINDPEEMHALLDLGADGILTDYPNLLLEVLAERNQ